MKTNIPLTDDPEQEEDLLRRYRERIEKLSQQDRVSKFCTDAGFLNVVEVGKILHNSHNSLMQWLVVGTLCQETKKHLNPKVGSEGTPRLDPYWKLQPVAYKISMEWKSQFSL